MVCHRRHRCFQQGAAEQFSVKAVEPVTRRSLGFAVERAWQVVGTKWISDGPTVFALAATLDFRGRCYPVEKRCRFRPAISRSLAVSARLDPSAPPSLAAGSTVRRVSATTQDSDCSGDPHGLGGVAALDRRSRHRLAAGALPAYPGGPSRPVALADPAERWRPLLTVEGLRLAAFAVPVAARLPDTCFEVHQMRFTVVTTGQCRRRRAFGFGLAASSLTPLSVVHSPI